jgi:beta-lactamase regulating signal transducer with metallopeptidase domain
MNVPISFTSPVVVILLRWTCLLALGWGVHGLLRHRHARWRLILWRGILCFGLALPLLHFLQVPGIKIPVARQTTHIPEAPSSLPPQTVVTPTQPALLQPQMLPAPTAASSPAPTVPSLPVPAPPKQIPWGTVFLLIWALGCVSGAIRLLRLHWQLSRLRRATSQPSPDLQRLAKKIQAQLKVQREPDVRISETVTSPFVCGLLRPAIILPRMLLEQLSPGELAALLTHEMAHLRHHDLLWSVAWRWLGAVCWFHPLVWRVPAVHNLACDQEADRVASGQMAAQDSYSQSLARLALRVLALPAVETKLTLNGSSQIARRLVHLGKEQTNAWNWRHLAAGIGLVGSLFLMTAAWGFSQAELLHVGAAPQSPETVSLYSRFRAWFEAAAAWGVPKERLRINAQIKAIAKETHEETVENILTNGGQFDSRQGGDNMFGEYDLEEVLSSRRAVKFLAELRAMPPGERLRQSTNLFVRVLREFEDGMHAVIETREHNLPLPTKYVNHRSMPPMCLALFAIAETGRRDVLAEQFDRLDAFQKRFEVLAEKAYENEYARKHWIERCVTTPRFQLNVLRLVVLRDPKARDALNKIDAYCRSLNMTTNEIPIVAWNARTTYFENMGTGPDVSKGVTTYVFYNWDKSYLYSSRFNEKREIVRKVRELAFSPP